MAGAKIKKNDTVQVITGREKGKTGKVVAVNYEKGKVIIEGVNMVKKSMKKRSQQDQGGIIEVEAALSISNVQLMYKNEATKVGYKIKNGKKVRIAKKTGEEL